MAQAVIKTMPRTLRLTLVQMPRWFVDVPPYSLAVLTGAARTRGFNVTQKDYDLELHYYLPEAERAEWQNTAEKWSNFGLINELLGRVPDFIEWCVDDILVSRPHVVGFSVKCLATIFTYAVAKRLKERSPATFIVIGGPEVGTAELSYFQQYPFVDAICRQEADVSFPNFLEKFEDAGFIPQWEPGFIYRDAGGYLVDCGRILAAPTSDQLPMADYSDYDFRRYLRPNSFAMLMSRGCINRCSFCSEAPSFLKHRALGASRLVAEIRHHMATTNVAHPPRIFFNDSLMNGDLDELSAFADALLEDPVPGLSYGGMMLIRKNMSAELIERVARSGCDTIFFGLETGSEVMIKIMRKKFKLDDAERILKSAHDFGIDVSVGIIIGHPGETEEEFYNTLEFLGRNSNNIDNISFNIMEMYGDSDVTRNPGKYDVVINTPQDWTSDGGSNTLRLRQARRDVAQILFYGKVADVSALAGRERLLKNPCRQLEAKIAEVKAQCGEALLLLKQLQDAPLRLERDGGRGVVESVTADEKSGITVVGWALDAVVEGPAHHILLFNGTGQLVAYTCPDLRRPDVSKAFGQPAFVNSGWSVRVDQAGGDLYVVALDTVRGRAFLLAGQPLPRMENGRFGPFITAEPSPTDNVPPPEPMAPGSETKMTAAKLDRQAIANAYLSGHGIEVGALHNPLKVPACAHVRYVDRMPVAELKQQYPELADFAVVDPDIVDNGEVLSTLGDASQDFVIANHFLEHCQDFIGTLRNFVRVLKPGGVIFAALPDMRFTFDKNRPATPLDHILRDYVEGPMWSRRAHFEEWATLVEPHFGRHFVTSEEVAARTDELLAQDYSIHYHVWEPKDVMALMATCCAILPLQMDVFLTLGEEMVMILTRRAD